MAYYSAFLALDLLSFLYISLGLLHDASVSTTLQSLTASCLVPLEGALSISMLDGLSSLNADGLIGLKSFKVVELCARPEVNGWGMEEVVIWVW